MPAAKKSPTFCRSEPLGADLSAAAPSRMSFTMAKVRSSTSWSTPYLPYSAGMAVRFSQAPTAYWKKSAQGLTPVSMFAGSKPRETCGTATRIRKRRMGRTREMRLMSHLNDEHRSEHTGPETYHNTERPRRCRGPPHALALC